MEELSELREFYDPDTVELMTWIRYKHTCSDSHLPIYSTHFNWCTCEQLVLVDQASFFWRSWLARVPVHAYIGICLWRIQTDEWWVMRADGSLWIRHGAAGKSPAVGSALTHLRVSAATISIKNISLMGAEMQHWFGMAPCCCCCCFFYVFLCGCHFLVIRLNVECRVLV